jgi:hypothetical protein
VGRCLRTAPEKGERTLSAVPKHLILPKSALHDVALLTRLDEDKLRALSEVFVSADSAPPSSPELVERVARGLALKTDAARAIVVVCQFLLTLVEQRGISPAEVLDDIREFVSQHDADLVGVIDAKRPALERLFTPSPERTRAIKVQSLTVLHPMVESFRTVCELRPVFERLGQEETIVGYVPIILLEATIAGKEGEENKVLLQLSAATLKKLTEVIDRTEEKINKIRERFGNELLGDVS